MARDDEQLARASRALRSAQGVRQSDIVGGGRSRHLPRLLESGRAGELRLDDIRSHFEKLGATIRVTPWWNGASLDRLLDERHAGVVNAAIRLLLADGWSNQPEVTFSEWGERGSIDVFGAHELTHSVFLGEVKSEWGSLEETLRVLDAKVRLAPMLAKKRWGWTPTNLGVALILPEAPTNRRIAGRYAATLEAAFPARNREIRRWLRAPSGRLRGLWFLSDVHGSVPQARPRP